MVDANITNAYLPISGNVSITAGTVDANITNALIPITGNVTVTAGTVDAQITGSNVTLDTSSTIVNEQVSITGSAPYVTTVSVPAGSTGTISTTFDIVTPPSRGRDRDDSMGVV